MSRILNDSPLLVQMNKCPLCMNKPFFFRLIFVLSISSQIKFRICCLPYLDSHQCCAVTRLVSESYIVFVWESHEFWRFHPDSTTPTDGGTKTTSHAIGCTTHATCSKWVCAKSENCVLPLQCPSNTPHILETGYSI